DAGVQPSGGPGQKVALDVQIFDARRRPLKRFVPAIDAVPGHVDFREIIIDTSSQAAAVPPDTVPRSPQAPPRSSRPQPREKLNIIIEGLRKRQQPGSV